MHFPTLREGNVLGESKIDDFDVTGGIHEKILRFQIAVCNAKRMNIPESADHARRIELVIQ